MSRQYDRVLATSMVDLATLRGLWPGLAATPATLYMHENQFAYPVTEQAHRSLEPQMVQLYSALAAETILFNSRFNRDSFLDGVAMLLARFPDRVPDGVVDMLTAGARVVPVGLDEKWFRQGKPIPRDRPIRLLWNHRWEYDKAPERLLAFLKVLARRRIDFRIDILGRSFRRRPASFDDLEHSFPGQIEQFGFLAEEDDYRDRLARADVVLSTALHDFQGLAVMQATAGGCRPLVPDRLAYPEFFAAGWCYSSFVDDPEREAEAMADRLMDVVTREPPGLDSLRWQALQTAYAGALGIG
jgi:glycosyltransferase involved in cell wall biosynthesis